MFVPKVRSCFLLGLVLAFVGCTHSQDQESADVASQPLSVSLSQFPIEGTEMDASTVSQDAQAKMLACDVPSTERRLIGDTLSTSYTVVTRSRESVDSHLLVEQEEKGYSTQSGGAIFKRMYALDRLTVDGSSPLSSGTLAYRDTCTTSGCDIKQREYLGGSASYLIDVQANLKKIMYGLDMRGKKNCAFRSTGAQSTSMIAQTSIVLAGTKYKALKFTTSQDGELYCDGNGIGQGNNSSVYMGKAKQMAASVVLADALPQLHNEMTRYTVYSSAGHCGRTTVMQSNWVESGGAVYSGSAKEITQFDVKGTLLSVADYNKALQDKQAMVNRTSNDVLVAKEEKFDADYQASDADDKVKAARSAADAAVADAAIADAAAARSGATDDDKVKAVLKRGQANAASANATRLESGAQSKHQLAAAAAAKLQEATNAYNQAVADLAKSQSSGD